MAGLVLAADEVGFDFGDGVEALGDEVGVGDFEGELLPEAGDEVGEGEGVEGAGIEEGFIGGGVVGDVGDCVDDFEVPAWVLMFTCFAEFVTIFVAFDGGIFIWFHPGAGEGRDKWRTAGRCRRRERRRARCSLRR